MRPSAHAGMGSPLRRIKLKAFVSSYVRSWEPILRASFGIPSGPVAFPDGNFAKACLTCLDLNGLVRDLVWPRLGCTGGSALEGLSLGVMHVSTTPIKRGMEIRLQTGDPKISHRVKLVTS